MTIWETLDSARADVNTVTNEVTGAFETVELIVNQLEEGEDIEPAKMLTDLTEVRDQLASATDLLGT